MSDDDSDEYMVDNAFNDENYELFDHYMLDMVGDAFDSHESNEGSSGLNEEAKTFFKLIEDAGLPLYPGCEEFIKLSFVVEMYYLRCLYGVTKEKVHKLEKMMLILLKHQVHLVSTFSLLICQCTVIGSLLVMELFLLSFYYSTFEMLL